MNVERESDHGWRQIAAAALAAAAAMYLLDPDKGRRRRAIVRDKAHSLSNEVAHLACAATRDTRNRLHGLRARAERLARHEAVPDDLLLIERVRSKLGRTVSHPHAIQVGARGGRVTLSGTILASEVAPLLDAVRSVDGVSEVEDHLRVYERPDHVPALQGTGRRMRLSPRPRNWTPALRLASLVGGGVLAACAARQSRLGALALGGIGLALAARGASNVAVRQVPGGAHAPPGRPVQTS